ncbi:hypothetical protein ILUMI_10779 [Ignelater luminosus]|uniref:DUF4817 domain-containing protein n=1 Tax=Ignelater luminosus TaxID=2038154 RepID=A0A8K0GDV0_IGNLU|nr:hypothetical protein ILUMI_10779 [Ignelater luminosus]
MPRHNIFTNLKMRDMLCVYAQENYSCLAAARRYREMYPNRVHPNRQTFSNIFSRLGDTGQFKPKSDVQRPKILTVDQEDDILVNQFCLILGAEQYKLLRETITPKTLQQVTYKEFCDALTTSIQSTKCTIAEGYRFCSRAQQKGEYLSDYIFVIKSLSLTCKFENFLDNALRNRLVNELENKAMRGAAMPGGRGRYHQQQHSFSLKRSRHDKDITLVFSPPYSTQSNGLAEDAAQTLRRMLTKLVLDNSRNKDNILTDCLFSYRVTPSSVTGVSPMVAMLTYTPKIALSVLSPVNESQLEEKPKSILKLGIPELSEGERVWQVIETENFVLTFVDRRSPRFIRTAEMEDTVHAETQ